MTTLADIQALGDVLDDFIDGIDSLSATDAIRFAETMKIVQDKAKFACELLKTRTLNQIEKQPVVVGGKIYASKADKKWRPNQAKIQGAVAHRACFDENGEKLTAPIDAAARAVLLMYDLFVAPSEMPKQTGLKKLGLSNLDVAEQEITGHSLKVVDLGETDD